MRRFAIAGTAVAVLLLASAAIAAGSGWSIQHTPNPTGGSDITLDGVSCASTGACTAVGYYYNPAQVTLAERWNGSKWSIKHTPKPTGAHGSALNGVACASAIACTAVGSYNSAATMVTLAERWNGTKWSIKHTPNPAGSSNSVLNGVSCASASACTAVGSYSNGTVTVTLAERWNGTKWSIQRIPSPAGASDSELNGVSCASTRACTAVGYSDAATLAERWNGTKWSIQHTPIPSAGSSPFFNGVSCPSTNVCTAVGDNQNGSTFMTLAERWNGTKWSIQQSPNPSSDNNNLYSVSCASTGACTTVGSYFNGVSLSLVERWNGAKWSVQQTPQTNPTTESNVLDGVSCASTGACTAVGYYFNPAQVTLAERWNRRG